MSQLAMGPGLMYISWHVATLECGTEVSLKLASVLQAKVSTFQTIIIHSAVQYEWQVQTDFKLIIIEPEVKHFLLCHTQPAHCCVRIVPRKGIIYVGHYKGDIWK